MRAAPRRRDSRDRGETLLELVLAISIMGGAGLVFLGALAAAWLNADRQDGSERARNLASTVAELSTGDNLRFEPCDGAAAAYQKALDAMVADNQGLTPATEGEAAPRQRFKLTVTEVAGWDGSVFTTGGTCDPETQRLQRVTVAVKDQGPGGAVQQVVFTKSRTKTDGSEALVDSTTEPASLGTFALSVASPQEAPAPKGTVRFAVFAPSDVACDNPLWQTLKDPADPQADPTAKAGRAATASLQQTPDVDFSDRQAKIDAPMFDIAGAFGNEPGTYRWRATYLGGAEADPSSTPCGGPGREIPLEQATIQLQPMTVEPGGVAVYQPRLQLGNVVPGVVRFRIHGLAPGAAGDPCTTGATRDLAPMQPAQNGGLQFQIDPSMYEDFGDYVITAFYSGDVGHLPLRQECQQGSLLRVRAQGELGLAVAPAPEPRLSAALTQGWNGQSGDPGAVTFRVFSTPDCATPVPGVEATVPMQGGQATATFSGLAPAEYWAAAEWTGDERNRGDVTSCQRFPIAGAPPTGPIDPMAPPQPMAPPPGAPFDPAFAPPAVPASRQL